MFAMKVRRKRTIEEERKAEEENLCKKIDKHLNKQVAKQVVNYSIDIMAMFLWSVAEYTESVGGRPWGKKKLLDLGRHIQPNLNELVKFYEMDEDDLTYLCLSRLDKNLGITADDLKGMLAVSAEVESKV